MYRREPESSQRVAFFLPDLHGGGAERVVLSLCRYFISEDIQVDLVLARARGTLIAKIPNRVRVIDLAPKLPLPTRAGFALGALFGLVRYLRREPPTVMAASLTGANLVALIAHSLVGAATRLVLREANTCDNLPNALTRRLVRKLYSRADTIIAVSQGVRDDLINQLGVRDDQVRVIYNPVDIDEIRHLAKEKISETWFAPKNPPVVLGIGRLVPQKDFATLLRAVAVIRRTQKVRLILLGEGPLQPSLQRLASELGMSDDFAMPGFVTNPYAYMRRAAVVVLSSRWEGMPNVLIQALSIGAPLVSTDCHSGPREILDGGRFGWLVPVNDPASLADAVSKSIAGENPADAEARIKRARCFSLDKIAGQYLEVLLPGVRNDCYD